jgi:hypothetical protein
MPHGDAQLSSLVHSAKRQKHVCYITLNQAKRSMITGFYNEQIGDLRLKKRVRVSPRLLTKPSTPHLFNDSLALLISPL